MAHSTYLIMKTYQSIGWYDEVPFPLAWTHGARSLYGTPLVAEFDGLDPEADYELSVTYQNVLLFDDHFNLKLWAGGELIHTELERKYKNGADPDPTYTWRCRSLLTRMENSSLPGRPISRKAAALYPKSGSERKTDDL